MIQPTSGQSAWLPYLSERLPEGDTPKRVAKQELLIGLRALHSRLKVSVSAKGEGEEYRIDASEKGVRISGGERGVLYAAYDLLETLARGEEIVSRAEAPAYALRMVNHWDNMDGSVERGYAGRSLFFQNGNVSFDPERIRRYARLLASARINAVSINNVNVAAPADDLITERFLPKLRRLAKIFRAFGIRLLLSVEYAMPGYRGAGTADPLDPSVALWWKNQVDAVYQAIPDLAGFLVKADSERRMGPFAYGRDHAQGANVIARALKAHGGTLVWRCFVYNCRQDWRDTRTDRVKAAYDIYSPLDGKFDDNVILQIKYGPYDFQVREPVSPLLLRLNRTRIAMEVQLTQEYTGHQIDLFYMAKLWRDLLSDLDAKRLSAVAAVSNVGTDENWTGHDLAQANLYAYGAMAWRGKIDPEETAGRYAALAFPTASDEVSALLLQSPDAYEKYASPLGLCWMVNATDHYGPCPEGYEFSQWGTYHRANFEAVGIERSGRGTGFTVQYPKALCERYDDVRTCPDALLLFFHRMRYDDVMRDGRALLQRIYDDHFEGAQMAQALLTGWAALKGRVPEETYQRVLERFQRQLQNAENWRDVINTYFFRLTNRGDAHGRRIYP